ncbi:uncharacterized protein BDZ99DRAFT_526404 [Mytilinidion resinicola]|uniref:Uncharacterized protein n=1 Tax=Mytilinidion resinicola TaxID=574789 RepID=A0A6A6Y639_9PEZI|nr:uncharacterized protein BDZ99DRAFT_526404 [Mytilinidion resinicola]KAF2803474.1 hypothetical protein BDZ99DRAFT_526404 [Mytilinidion resinicola]
MYLKLSPRPSEEKGLAPEQLELILTNIEKKKQKLEDDIAQYIQARQHDLHEYEQTLLGSTPTPSAASISQIQPLSNIQPPPRARDATPPSDESPKPTSATTETAKPQKPNRVHKREMELRGLMAFIPLLDANDAATTKQKKARSKSKETRSEAEGSLASLGESSKSASSEVIPGPGDCSKMQEPPIDVEPPTTAEVGTTGASVSKKKKPTAELKGKRVGTRKSSLRRVPSTKAVHRKRVSLAVDDQIVHPSDSLIVTSPLSDSTTNASSNASSSIENLEDTAHASDPGPVHHSLTMSPETHATTALFASPPSLQHGPPHAVTETFVEHDERLSRSPDEEALAIYADEPPAPISTYVGGLSGSGVDDVDQAGSYGYPSSLGASYMESYMASRPLSVRIAAAEKAELEEEEAKKLIRSEERADVAVGRVEETDPDDGFLGEMDNI